MTTNRNDDMKIIDEARKRRKLTRDEDTQLEYRREQGTLAYYANTGVYPDGCEPTQGLSTVQHNIMRPCVDTLTTYHKKSFLDDDPIEMRPVNNTNREQMKAMQNSKLLNAVWRNIDIGQFVEQLTQTSLVNITGFSKAYWDNTPHMYTDTYQGITLEQANAIAAVKEEMGATDVVIEGEASMMVMSEYDPMTGEEVEVEVEEPSEFTISCMLPTGLPTAEVVKPERVEVNLETESINRDNRTSYVGIYSDSTPRDIYNEWKDIVPDLKDRLGDLGSYEQNTSDEEEIREILLDKNAVDGVEMGENRTVELIECWFKPDDLEGNICHMIYSGGVLLLKEDWNGQIPISENNPFPIPHQLYGLSVWDKIRDKQIVLTALRRNAVDYTILTSTNAMSPFIMSDAGQQAVANIAQGRVGPRLVDSQVDDVKAAVMFAPVPAQPNNHEQIATQVKQEVISEIGIDYINGVVSAEIEKSGNDEAKTAQVMDSASTKIETQIRRLADGAITDHSWIFLQLLIDHADTPSVRTLVESVTPGMPFLAAEDGFTFNPTMRGMMQIKAGLGHISRDVKIQRLAFVQQQQLSILGQGGFVPPQKLQAPSKMIAELLDQDPEQFFASEMELQQFQMAQQQAMQAQSAAQAAQIQQQMQISSEVHQMSMQEGMARTAEIIAKAKNIPMEQALKEAEFLWQMQKDQAEIDLERVQQRPVSF